MLILVQLLKYDLSIGHFYDFKIINHNYFSNAYSLFKAMKSYLYVFIVKQ